MNVSDPSVLKKNKKKHRDAIGSTVADLWSFLRLP